MSRWVARSHDDELVDARRPAVKLGPLLGASAVALVVLGVLALLAGKGLEPFAGSVSVLAGLLCGATLVVVGLAGVARRNAERLTGAAARRETPQVRPLDGSDPPDDRPQRVDDTRVMRTVAIGLPPPPVPPRRPSVVRTVAGPDR